MTTDARMLHLEELGRRCGGRQNGPGSDAEAFNATSAAYVLLSGLLAVGIGVHVGEAGLSAVRPITGQGDYVQVTARCKAHHWVSVGP